MLSSSNMSGCGEQQLPAASSVVNNPYKRRQHATSDSEVTAQKRQATLDQDGVSSSHDDTLPFALGPSHDRMDVGESRIRTPPSDCNNDDEEMSSFDQAQDEEDDATNFELDFALCPEVGAVTSKLSRLNIQEEEVGDEQQVKAIHHAQSGDNMFLTGKGRLNVHPRGFEMSGYLLYGFFSWYREILDISSNQEGAVRETSLVCRSNRVSRGIDMTRFVRSLTYRDRKGCCDQHRRRHDPRVRRVRHGELLQRLRQDAFEGKSEEDCMHRRAAV